MNILIVGGGGREHALAWKISQNSRVKKIYCAPGNAGTELLEKGENIALNTTDDILKFAIKHSIDLTIVGSEKLLVEGIVDLFNENNLKIFGPDKKAAQLEGSKAYAKNFMKKYNVKTAAYEIFQDPTQAKAYLGKSEYPLVIKADGLAAGKGVFICNNQDEALKVIDDVMIHKMFGNSGNNVVIEEYLEGTEASILTFTDSKEILPLISAKDHKKIGEGETGLNTGGMGVVAPNPYYTDEIDKLFKKDILTPTLDGIKDEKLEFCGCIFFGVMITKKGVYLLEYNMRMGDPETQGILPLLDNDLYDIFEDILNGDINKVNLSWKKQHCCCVIAASGGYPLNYSVDERIFGTSNIHDHLFIAGARLEDNKLLTSGGRVLGVYSLSSTLDDARKKSYTTLKNITFKDIYYRTDI